MLARSPLGEPAELPPRLGPFCWVACQEIAVIIEDAEAVLARDGVEADSTEFVDETFEDAAVEQLLDPARDGIEASEWGRKLGMAHLFEDWRRPIRAGNRVHAYVHFD